MEHPMRDSEVNTKGPNITKAGSVGVTAEKERQRNRSDVSQDNLFVRHMEHRRSCLASKHPRGFDKVV